MNLGLLRASSGEDDEYLKSSSSSADETSGKEDTQTFDNWMEEVASNNEDKDNANVPPTVDVAVDPPTCTNMTAPTKNNKRKQCLSF